MPPPSDYSPVTAKTISVSYYFHTYGSCAQNQACRSWPSTATPIKWDTEEYGEANLAAFIPFELQRDLIDKESRYLLSAGLEGGPTGATFQGLLATSGTLTREYVSEGDAALSPLDTVAAAFNDMRVGAAFCFPDLVLTSPSTLFTLRTEKDPSGRYIWDLMQGPAAMTASGQTAPSYDEPVPYSITPQGSPAIAGQIWGVPVAIARTSPMGRLWR